MLFEEDKYFYYKFPEPQYLGAKFLLLNRINSFIPDWTKKVLDWFWWSQSISYLFKQKWFSVITNDFMNFNNQIWLSLIENSKEKIKSQDLKILFDEQYDPNFKLMEQNFTNIFFERNETIFLDLFCKNVDNLSNKYKKSLAISTMNRVLTKKTTMWHFAHLKAIEYSKNPNRIKRNRSIARPIKDMFEEMIVKYNNAVFDNSKDNKSFNMNILDLIDEISKENIDLIYLDPPYCDSHSDYQSFYHLLETFTNYWKDKEFVNWTKRYEPKIFSWFDKKQDVINSFEILFNKSKYIPNWLISWNDRSYPDIKSLVDMISKYKEVEVKYKEYSNSRWWKWSVAGSKEVLFVCKDKKIF